MEPDYRKHYIEAAIEREWRQAWRDAKPESERTWPGFGFVLIDRTLDHRHNVRIAAVRRILDRRLAVEEELLKSEGIAAPPEWVHSLERDVRRLMDELGEHLRSGLEADLQELLFRGNPSPHFDRLLTHLRNIWKRQVKSGEVSSVMPRSA